MNQLIKRQIWHYIERNPLIEFEPASSVSSDSVECTLLKKRSFPLRISLVNFF